ncbi:protein MAINTENANCE OF MERISTEMS-like [Papaver somniferum]|uniref:protein MAINTENANCE OF MERISTEMS-like n=1 Tax=Papaver somniferum TaxID=3469 RepID=UPI000E6FBD26|nr:protein MAINTENANCE OF MERISTEMS-like [Papaver somniferum]
MDMFKGTKEKEEKGTLTDEQVNHAATAYLLCVLGCVIFPNTSGNRVDANLLQLLDPLDKVHEYSWGTECHAWLMEELRKASRVGISQVAGNVSLLQAWIYDHFPILKLSIDPAWKKGDPRGTKYVFDDKHSRTKEQQLIRLREVLDSLTTQDVCFDPYKED